MKKYIILLILICVSSSYAQLNNIINKTPAQLSEIIDNQTDSDAAYWESHAYLYIQNIVDRLQADFLQANDYATLSAAISAASTDTLSVMVSSRYNITTNTTLSGQTAIIARQGARFNVSSGDTLTINIPFYAGNYKVFEGSGEVIFGHGNIIETNPVWWGAKVNDGIDDSGAINSAIKSLNSYGGRIVLFPGIYTIGSTITMQDRIHLVGTGSETKDNTPAIFDSTTTFKASSALDPMVSFGDGSYGVHAASIEKISLLGESMAKTAIELYGTANNTQTSRLNQIKDNFINGFTENGIRITEWAFSNDIIHNTITSIDTSINIFARGNDLLIDDNDIFNSGVWSIYYKEGGMVRITNNQLENNSGSGQAILCESTAGQNLIQANYFEGFPDTTIIANIGINCNYNLFTGNASSNASSVAISLEGGRSSIIGNVITFGGSNFYSDAGILLNGGEATVLANTVVVAGGATRIKEAKETTNSIIQDTDLGYVHFGTISTTSIPYSFGDGSSSNEYIRVNSQAGQSWGFQWASKDTLRWILRTDASSESGSNAGTNLEFVRRSDTGGNLGSVLTLNRQNGQVDINGRAIPDTLSIPTNIPSSPQFGDVFVKQDSLFFWNADSSAYFGIKMTKR